MNYDHYPRKKRQWVRTLRDIEALFREIRREFKRGSADYRLWTEEIARVADVIDVLEVLDKEP